MGVLGKDLFDFHQPQTNTKVEFGASAYWVEDRPKPQPYGAVLTEVLNLDVAPFQELLDQLNTVVQEKSDDVLRAYMNMKKGLAAPACPPPNRTMHQIRPWCLSAVDGNQICLFLKRP